jgi:hypothetical protein
MEIPSPQLEHFKCLIQSLEDPRVERTRCHSLPLLVFTAIGTTLSGGNSFYGMELFCETHHDFLAHHFAMSEEPSHDTFNRLFQAIRPQSLNAFLAAFAQTLRTPKPNNTDTPAPPDIIAFDGKTTRRSHHGAIPALHTLNAWAGRNRLVIGQLATAEKSNEITAVPELMRALDITGCVVTADALNPQKDIAAQAVSQGADDLFPLKGTPPAGRVRGEGLHGGACRGAAARVRIGRKGARAP